MVQNWKTAFWNFQIWNFFMLIVSTGLLLTFVQVIMLRGTKTILNCHVDWDTLQYSQLLCLHWHNSKSFSVFCKCNVFDLNKHPAYKKWDCPWNSKWPSIYKVACPIHSGCTLSEQLDREFVHKNAYSVQLPYIAGHSL